MAHFYMTMTLIEAGDIPRWRNVRRLVPNLISVHTAAWSLKNAKRLAYRHPGSRRWSCKMPHPGVGSHGNCFQQVKWRTRRNDACETEVLLGEQRSVLTHRALLPASH